MERPEQGLNLFIQPSPALLFRGDPLTLPLQCLPIFDFPGSGLFQGLTRLMDHLLQALLPGAGIGLRRQLGPARLLPFQFGMGRIVFDELLQRLPLPVQLSELLFQLIQPLHLHLQCFPLLLSVPVGLAHLIQRGGLRPAQGGLALAHLRLQCRCIAPVFLQLLRLALDSGTQGRQRMLTALQRLLALAQHRLQPLQPGLFRTQFRRPLLRPGVLGGTAQGTGLAFLQLLALLFQIGDAIGQLLQFQQILLLPLQRLDLRLQLCDLALLLALLLFQRGQLLLQPGSGGRQLLQLTHLLFQFHQPAAAAVELFLLCHQLLPIAGGQRRLSRLFGGDDLRFQPGRIG